MNCTECKEMLAAYIEGLIEDIERVELEEHLNRCPLCRQELSEFKALHQKLTESSRNWQQTDLENDVINRVIREQNERLRQTSRVNRRLDIWRTIMTSRITKLAAAAVIMIAVLFGIGRFFGGTVTFAQVIEPILNARSVVVDLVMGEETGPVIHDIVVGTRIRRTFSNMDTILILDLGNAKMLTLDPKTKGAMYIDIQGRIQEGTKDYLGFVRDVVFKVQNDPDIPVQELGQQEIDGQKAIGFLIRGSNEEVTIWADPKTAMPIHIEMLLGKSLTKQTHYILKNIEFNVHVDESLVSMEPPADYTLAGMEYSMSNFSEQDFVESLRIWAEYLNEGNFPETLGVEDFFKAVPLFGERLGQSNLSQEEGTRIGMAFSRGLMFFQMIAESGCDWYYAGNGVKLGEADKPVFWYQPKGSDTYHVIYGDLSVKDVLPQDLPK
jgi:hypothetical protein